MRILVLLLALAPAVVFAGASSDALKNCKAQWPGNGALILACKKNQMADRKAVKRLAKQSRMAWDIADACIKASPGVVRGRDWSDAMLCARIRIKAAKRRR